MLADQTRSDPLSTRYRALVAGSSAGLSQATKFVPISRLYKRKPSQGLEPWTPSLPFKSPRRNRRARMTPQVPQIHANRAHERPAGCPRGDALARVGVRTVWAHGWSAGMAGSGSPSVAVCDVLLGRRGAAWWDPCTAERIPQDARRQALCRRNIAGANAYLAAGARWNRAGSLTRVPRPFLL
jgi:hypothetical protein